MILELTQEDVSLILTALSKGVYEHVAPLINKITSQFNGERSGTRLDEHPARGNGGTDPNANGDNLEGSQKYDPATNKRVPKAQ